ncbi:thioesterase II family protein [Amycolatopsis sp. cg9]|uniref:thioesterase II family protein n=1 Tax=Amycolatopsis sp. cg9 TaxID=3238801 RepID=UPI003523802C
MTDDDRRTRLPDTGSPDGRKPVADRWPGFRTWFRPVSSGAGPSRIRLFCFPHAGGSASAFSSWRAGVPDGLEIHAAQLPGRESRIMEPPISALDELVDQLTTALEPAIETGERFALFGHSAGALVAWELARSVRGRFGIGPVHLFVSACQSPSNVRAGYDDLHGLDDADLLARLGKMNGIPAEAMANPELMRMVLPVIQADFSLLAGYDAALDAAPAGVLDCPVTALGGDRDPVVAPGALTRWAEVTTAELDVRVLPGDHFYLTDPRSDVLGVIGARLALTTSGNV